MSTKAKRRKVIKSRDKMFNGNHLGKVINSSDDESANENAEGVLPNLDKIDRSMYAYKPIHTFIDNQTSAAATNEELQNDKSLEPVNCGSESDSTSNDEENDYAFALMNDLKKFAAETNQTRASMNNLLKKLSKYHPFLPNDFRTISRNICVDSRSSDLKTVSPGHYYHFGLLNGLQEILLLCDIENDTISISLNIDGLPLFKSSVSGFWIISAAIDNVNHSVFLVGAYFGSKKPASSSVFLRDLIDEIKLLLFEGINVNDRLLRVKFSCCCCDMPAKAFVKCVKSHSSYFGCDRCEISGEDYRNRRIYLDYESPLRSNDSFRNRTQAEHHIGDSAFEEILEIDMILFFPFDYMHLICKGICVRLLEILRSGSLPYRLSAKSLILMDEDLLDLVQVIPSDFARKPRSLKHLSLWKATETRLFCMYIGPITLKKHCNNNFYQIFMVLFVIMRIICDPDLCRIMHEYCKELVKYFLSTCANTFGKEFVTMNSHCLLHLVDDVARIGCADEFSCFKFENFMRFIKKQITSPYKPLEQLVNRVKERGSNLNQFFKSRDTKQMNNVQINGAHVSATPPNCYVMTTNRKVVKIFKIKRKQAEDQCLFGHELEDAQEAFTYPISSYNLNIYKGSCFSKDSLILKSTDISCKMFHCRDWFLPVLHTKGHDQNA